MSLVEVFGPSEIRGIKLRMMVEKLGKKILLLSALACCEQTMRDIAESCSLKKLHRKNPNAGKGKKPQLPVIPVSIYDGEVEKVNKELEKTNPNWQSFDITFLNKILSLIEADFPNFFANEVRDIKNQRNDKMHNEAFASDADFDREIEKLIDLFTRALDEAEKIATTRLSESQMNQVKREEASSALSEIQTLRTNIFGEVNRIKFEKVDETLSKAEEYLQIFGHDEISASFKSLVFMNPVSFLMGKKFEFYVERFYTQPEFTMKGSEALVSLNCILDTIEATGKNFLIEGQAGVGKSTFMRLLMAKKSSGERFENLLIIPYECRKKNLSTLSQVIADTLPKASRTFSEDTLVKATLSFKPIFLIDGLDERNETSDKVLKEILSLVVKKQARLLATSRPEGVENFFREIDKGYEYIEINGIAKEDLNDIVMSYYDIFSENRDLKDLPAKKHAIDEVHKMWHHFKGHIRSPLILCLITYLLVNKVKSNLQNESVTSIYISIFDALFKKLKTRLIDKDGASFNPSRFRMEVKKFGDILCQFSLGALKKDKFLLSFDESRALVEDFTDSFGDEALSAMLVGKGSVTRTGNEINSYSYPHKSFQEFLAAKKVSEMVASRKIKTLSETLHEKNLMNLSLIYFIIGLLAQDCKLDKGFCKEIASILKLKDMSDPFAKKIFSGILLEANGDQQMMDSLASKIETISIDSNFDDLVFYNSILRSTSSLRIITLSIAFNSELITSILALLRDRKIWIILKLPLTQNSEKLDVGDIIKEIIGGRCALKYIEGRLGPNSLKMLPKEISRLKLVVETEREAEGLRWLSEDSRLFHDLHHFRQHGRVEHLNINVLSGCDVDWLPETLPLPNVNLKATIVNEDSQGIERVLKFAKKFPKGCKKENCTTFQKTKLHLELDCNSATFKDLYQLSQLQENYKLKIFTNSDLLSGEERRKIFPIRHSNFNNDLKLKRRFTTDDIKKLPKEIDFITVLILDSADAEALSCLEKRIQGGTAELLPISIYRLVLWITPSCFPESLPQVLPAGKFLYVWLDDTDGERDFEWLLQLADRLPKFTHPCQLSIRIDIRLPLSKWEEFLERLRVNQVETSIYFTFSSLTKEEEKSLTTMGFEAYGIRLRRLSQDDKNDSQEDEEEEEEIGGFCVIL